MNKMKPVILYGNNVLARRVFFECKQKETDFYVAAFCVGDNFLNGDTFFEGLPLIAESEIMKKYPPNEYDMLSCIDAPTKIRNRLLVYDKLKSMGYFLRNYISPFAYVSEQVETGENNIILGFSYIFDKVSIGHSNTIRMSVTIGNDCILGNGTNIGAGSVIGGATNIGNSCWLGLNCTINDHITIADETLVGSGAVVIRNTEQGTTYVGNPAKPISCHKETGIMLNH